MTAAALDRRVASFFLVYRLMAILAQFMGCLLEAVDIRIADVEVMALCTFINSHHIVLGMVTDYAAE
jgi:hypothetical protein